MPGYPCCCNTDDECSTLFNVGAVDQFQISVPAALFDANASDAGDDDQWCNDTECDAKTGTFLLDPETQGNLTRGIISGASFVCGYKSETFQACFSYQYDELSDTWSLNEDNYHWELIFNIADSEFGTYHVTLYLVNEDFGSYFEQWEYDSGNDFTPTLNVTTGFTVRHWTFTSAGFEFCVIDAGEDITITEAP